VGILYSNADASEDTGLVHVETQDGGGLAFTPTTTTIPAGYKDIIISGNVRSSIVSGNGEYLRLYLNGDTTDANYKSQYHYAQGTGHAVGTFAWPLFAYARNSAGSGADSTSAFRCCLPDYSNSTNRAVAESRLMDWKQTGDLPEIQDHTIIWLDSVAAVTSILVHAGTATLAAGSSFTVWVR